jgi:hypothetical protein
MAECQMHMRFDVATGVFLQVLQFYAGNHHSVDPVAPEMQDNQQKTLHL